MTALRWLPAPLAESEALTARAFGARPGDLAVDFAGPPEAALTALLAACLTDATDAPIPPAAIDGWTVKKRRQGLLAVAVATLGPSRDVTARCSDPDCRALMELPLDLTRFRADWRVERIRLALGSATVVHLRPPGPADLAAWIQAADTAPAVLAARLVLDRSAPETPDWADAAEAALAEDDGLADLVIDTACPGCGQPTSVPLTLETLLMNGLQVRAAALLDEIHVIATAYHWSEVEILALPETRRLHYLARIAEAWT